MKIAVISDTHDHLGRIERALLLAAAAGCRALVHLGDIVSPFAALRLQAFTGPVHAVFGNNDGERAGLRRAFATFAGAIAEPPHTLDLAGRRLLLLHDPLGLDEAVRAGRHDYVLYGHLHQVDLRRAGAVTVLNPGDGSGWLAPATFFVVDLESGECRPVDIDRG
jgi:uncharacterized protein